MKSAGPERRIREKMTERGLPATAVERFLGLVSRVREERSAYIPLDDVSAPDSSLILDPASLAHGVRDLEARGLDLISRTVVIKLNGGRSTTMGGEVPKGTLIAKDGRSYLDIIAGQMKAFERKWGSAAPLVLMNSFFTHEPTLEIVRGFDIPVRTFIQSQVPRLLKDTLEPLDTGTEEDWAPPGHGDVYDSLKWSGLLDRLLAEGRTIAFISNLDNLAATLEPWILGLIGEQRAEFLMEVTPRTESDRKGGTLVVRNGRLDLLEIAQVAPEEKERFMEIDEFPVFNTNSIWVDLEVLSEALDKDALRMPVIRNPKSVAGSEIVQLETAMGSAVGSFARARGLRVERDRFFPTKKVEDLFVLQSDACILDDMDRIRRNPDRPEDLPLRPKVVFDAGFLDSPLRMSERFEDPSTVSLVRAASLEVKGPVYFHRNVSIEGNVVIEPPEGEIYRIPRGSVLREGNHP
jgi:UTP--glucose-1-phosphate uridylyltransferase